MPWTVKRTAIWAAIERACATDGFEPRPSGLCSVCGYRDVCPAWSSTATRAAPAAPQHELVAAAL